MRANSASVTPRSDAMVRKTVPPSRWSSPSRTATVRATVLVPEPGRPDRVISTWSGEGGEQCFALLLAEPAQTAGVGDADLVHRAPSLDLAHAGQGLEYGED